MSHDAAGSRLRSRLILVILFALFMLPIAVALVMNMVAPNWLPFGQVNRGQLVQPPVPAGLSRVQPLDGGLAPGADPNAEAVWALAHVSTGACERSCQEALIKMRQARLALGKDAGRIARWWLMTDDADTRTVSQVDGDHPGLRRGRIAAESALVDVPGQVLLVDPAGLLILRYVGDDSASAILKDLKRLLKISTQG